MADNPILAVLGSESSDTDPDTGDKGNDRKKMRAAEDLISAVNDEQAQGVVDALSAIVRLLELDSEPETED